jgi:hypothetical protein
MKMYGGVEVTLRHFPICITSVPAILIASKLSAVPPVCEG